MFSNGNANGKIEKKKLNILDENKKFKLYIAESYLNSLIRYTYSQNDYLNKRNLVNLGMLLDLIDEENTYKDFATCVYKFRFLKESVKFILEEKVISSGDDGDQILRDYFYVEIEDSYIPEDIKKECFQIIFNYEDLTNTEILQLTNYVEEKLSYAFLYKEEDRFADILNRLKSGDNTKDLVADCKEMVVDLNRKLSNVASMNEFASRDFSLAKNDTTSIKLINEYLINKRKGDFKLKSGYQALNRMLNGGFEGGRVYMFFGPTKGFKSGTLLNLAITLARCNPEFKLNDTTKKPCIVYFTQENTEKETLDRMCECIFGAKEIKEWSAEQVLEGIRSYTLDVNGIDLKIIYRPNKSVSTNYLYNIYENLELDGEECICMIQDYVKRIKSTSNFPDIRIELGEVVNEFSTFAKEKSIPLITAGQLNREATRIVDNHLQGEKAQNAAKLLNASHIGESLLMLENTDYGIIVNREKSLNTDDEYVSFKLIASRAKNQDKEFEYFAQPICSDGGFRIKEDLYDEKMAAVDNIGSYLENYNEDGSSKNQTAVSRFNNQGSDNSQKTSLKDSIKSKRKSKNIKDDDDMKDFNDDELDLTDAIISEDIDDEEISMINDKNKRNKA